VILSIIGSPHKLAELEQIRPKVYFSPILCGEGCRSRGNVSEGEGKMVNYIKGGPTLKGPKLEIFGFRVFSQIRPVWVGDLGTRQKNAKF
jgi:hypothetical protein